MFFLRALEGDDGDWTCHRGRSLLDLHAHPDLEEALVHLREVAASIEGAVQVVLHYRNGSTEVLDDES